MRLPVDLAGLVFLLAPVVFAQGNNNNNQPAPNAPAPNAPATTDDDREPADTDSPGASQTSSQNESSQTSARPSTQGPTSAQSTITSATSTSTTASSTGGNNPSVTVSHASDIPTIAGYGVPPIIVPNTQGAPYMQKSNLPDGTVFICVGAALGFFGAAILAWRGLVAWSLHRSVKRAAMAQNLADLKAMSAVPGKKRGMYNVVNANSNMSLDRLSAAPTGTSRPPRPFVSTANANTPPRAASSLFFSPTAGGAAGLRDSQINRSSTYLPAGYYPTSSAQPAQGAPLAHVGGNNAHLSTNSLAMPGNRLSARSGISPPVSPSLPPSRGGAYDRAPPSRDGFTNYNRNSVATLGTAPNRSVYAGNNASQLSLDVPGGTSAPGGRAPSAYLEDLFENHGNGPRERF